MHMYQSIATHDLHFVTVVSLKPTLHLFAHSRHLQAVVFILTYIYPHSTFIINISDFVQPHCMILLTVWFNVCTRK